MRDFMSYSNPKPAFYPVAAITDNTAMVSTIVDTAGYEGVTLILITGTLTDADATFALTMEHGNAANLSDSTVPVQADLVGTGALANYTFSDDNKTFKIGYVGTKRYIRATVTPTANTGNFFMAGIWQLAGSRFAPTSNPPN